MLPSSDFYLTHTTQGTNWVWCVQKELEALRNQPLAQQQQIILDKYAQLKSQGFQGISWKDDVDLDQQKRYSPIIHSQVLYPLIELNLHDVVGDVLDSFPVLPNNQIIQGLQTNDTVGGMTVHTMSRYHMQDPATKRLCMCLSSSIGLDQFECFQTFWQRLKSSIPPNLLPHLPIGPDGWTTFGMIVLYGRATWMMWAQQQGAFDPDVKADGGKNLIHACLPNPNKPFGLKGGHLATRTSMIEFLVQNQVDINALDIRGASPLLQAAICNDPSFFLCLLDHGANPDQGMEDFARKVTPLRTQLKKHMPEYFDVLTSWESKKDLISQISQIPPAPSTIKLSKPLKPSKL